MKNIVEFPTEEAAEDSELATAALLPDDQWLYREANKLIVTDERPDHYILRDKKPVPVRMEDWAMWLEGAKHQRIVGRTEINGYRVSTVFLGLDHNHSKVGEPHLFETMIFAGDSWSEEWCERCGTWEDAEKQHEKGVNFVVTTLTKGK